MGPVFILAFWLLVSMVAAVVLSAAAWSASVGKPRRLRWGRVIFAFVVPFGFLLWVCPAGMLWVGWGALTGFNAQFGIGDWWETPLPKDYRLLFVDTEAHADILGPRDRAVLVANVTMIAATGNRVYGHAEGGGFVVDTTLGETQRGPAAVLFEKELLDGSALIPVSQYPGRTRNMLDNIVLIALVFGPPSLAAWYIWTRKLTDTRV